MTIEAKLEALTKAVEANTTALLGRAGVQAIPAKQAQDKARAEVAASAKKPEVKADAKAVNYDDIKEPFVALVKLNRDEALATLKPFGLDSLKGAKPEQFYAVHTAVTKKLAELQAKA